MVSASYIKLVPSVTAEFLARIADRIVVRFNPEKIVLFGSHAWGTPRFDSDVDLLVVMERTQRPAQASAAIRRECRPRFLAMDVLVQTPAELQARLEMRDPFFRRILERGRVLYER